MDRAVRIEEGGRAVSNLEPRFQIDLPKWLVKELDRVSGDDWVLRQAYHCGAKIALSYLTDSEIIDYSKENDYNE